MYVQCITLWFMVIVQLLKLPNNWHQIWYSVIVRLCRVTEWQVMSHSCEMVYH